MILTNNEGAMVLTPTYYVFKMYNVHQDATYIPLNITCKEVPVRDNRTVPMLSATASKDKDGKVHISLSNVDADNEQTVTINLTGVKATKAVGEILTAKDMTDHNTFEHPDAVKPVPFKDAKLNKDVLTLKLPAKSIVTLELQ
jgi:alpha-N-arabinofuranosidase